MTQHGHSVCAFELLNSGLGRGEQIGVASAMVMNQVGNDFAIRI